MALRLIPGKKLFKSPPGGWNETEPLTKQRVHGDNFSDLCDKEIRLLRINSIPVPADIVSQIESRFAEKLPDDWVYDPDAKPNAPKPNRAGRTVVMRSVVDERTTKIIKAWEAVGRPKLDRATAEIRAAICFKCPKHAPMGCLTCDGTYQDLQQRMGKDLAVTNDKNLQACGVDSVFNKVQIWLPDAVIQKLLPKIGRLKIENYPEACWKRAIMASVLPPAPPAPGDQQGTATKPPTPATESTQPLPTGTEQTVSAPEVVRESEPVQTAPVSQAPISNETVPSLPELQDRETVSRLAHNQEITGANPVPATIKPKRKCRACGKRKTKAK